MDFKSPIEKHVKKGMMVQMFQNGILKMNHLLFDELFKRKETRSYLGIIELFGESFVYRLEVLHGFKNT